MVERTWVAELDRDVLRVVIAEGSAKHRTIVHSHSSVLESDDAQELRSKLKSAVAGFDLIGADGYLLVSDRRLVHGDLHFDRLPRKAMRDGQVLMAARELGLWEDEVPIAAAWRSQSCVGGGVRIVFDATQTSLIDQVAAATEILSPGRLWIASLESAVAEAYALYSSGLSVAVLDVRSSHASFILCRDGRVESSRRFKLPFAHEDSFGSEALLPLAMEVARSIEFLGDLGIDPPSEILVTGDIELESFDGEAWSDAFGMIDTRIVDADFLRIVPSDVGFPHAWGTAAYILTRRRAPKLCWLHEPQIRSLAQKGAGIAARFVSAAAMLAGLTLFCESRSAASLELVRRSDSLRAEVASFEERARAPAPTIERVGARRGALSELDRGRFAASRFCAALSIDKPERVALTTVAIDDAGGASVTGVIRAKDRLVALSEFSAFNRRLGRVLQQRELGGSLAQDLGDDTGIVFEIFAKRRRESTRERGQ